MCPVGRFSVVLSSTESRAYAVFCGTDCDRRSKKKTSDQPQALAPYGSGSQGVGISTHSKWAFITGFDPRCAYLSIIPMETRQHTHTHTHTPALTKPAPPTPPPLDTRTYACRAPIEHLPVSSKQSTYPHSPACWLLPSQLTPGRYG